MAAIKTTAGMKVAEFIEVDPLTLSIQSIFSIKRRNWMFKSFGLLRRVDW